METLITSIVTVLASMLASGGFWAIIQKKLDKKDGKTKLLLGLGHDRIVFLGMQYVRRGFITQDEYENLHDYLYLPYVENGGNGSAKKVMEEVDKLPMYKTVEEGMKHV